MNEIVVRAETKKKNKKQKQNNKKNNLPVCPTACLLFYTIGGNHGHCK